MIRQEKIEIMKKKIIGDMVLNIFSTALPVAILQLLILPKMAGQLGDDSYGLLIASVGLTQTVSATLGNVLNNIRLIWNSKYEEDNIAGDFNIILLVLNATNIVVVLGFTIQYEGFSNIGSIVLTCVLAVTILLCEYLQVGFRLIINYKSILLGNIIKCLGYGVGYFIFRRIQCWQIVYLCGQVFCLFFIVSRTSLLKEPFKKTKHFSGCAKATAELSVAKTLNSITTYADKNIVFPLLGGASVSIYYAATVLGKIVSMAINPINSVALTYLSKKRNKSDKTFWTTIFVSIIVCAIGSCICIIISKPLLTYLYPQYVEEAMKLIGITTAAMAVRTMIAVADPFILRYFDMKWQLMMNSINMCIYVGLGILLIHAYGLIGFCWGTLIAYVLKFCIMLVVYLKVQSHNIV